MHDSDMADDRDKIKPGESLFTPAWRTATWKMTLEQRGFAQSALMLMYLDGWQDIPDAETLAKGTHIHIRVVRRLLPVLEALPAHTVAEQVKRIARWPDLIIEELRP